MAVSITVGALAFCSGVAVGAAVACFGAAVGAAVAVGLGVEVGAAVAVGFGVEVGAAVAVGFGVEVGAAVAVGFGVEVGSVVGDTVAAVMVIIRMDLLDSASVESIVVALVSSGLTVLIGVSVGTAVFRAGVTVAAAGVASPEPQSVLPVSVWEPRSRFRSVREYAPVFPERLPDCR